jgi:tetratricopeptide (TPR) repeat protein
MRLIKYILTLFVFATCIQANAQQYTAKAYAFYQAQDFDQAKIWVDSAVVSDEKSNSQTWQLKGLIYRKLESDQHAEYREVAIAAFVEARNTDTDGAYKEKIDGYVYNTVIRYYNDAVTNLEAHQFEASESSYVSYKTNYLKHIDSSYSFVENDIEFYNALGGACLKFAPEMPEATKESTFENGVKYFEMVLKLDPAQFDPNFNIGIMYYNKGADLIIYMDPLTPIEEIPVIESRAQENFKKALPYLHEAHKLDPTRSDILEAITGCYFGLQDNENYNKYQKILDEKNLPNLLEKHKTDPKNRDIVRELVRIYSSTFKDDEKYKKYAEILNNLDE